MGPPDSLAQGGLPGKRSLPDALVQEHRRLPRAPATGGAPAAAAGRAAAAAARRAAAAAARRAAAAAARRAAAAAAGRAAAGRAAAAAADGRRVHGHRDDGQPLAGRAGLCQHRQPGARPPVWQRRVASGMPGCLRPELPQCASPQPRADRRVRVSSRPARECGTDCGAGGCPRWGTRRTPRLGVPVGSAQ
jgi:hypothetical protein